MDDVKVECHCGAIALNLRLCRKVAGIQLCHCYGCRHSTGQLFASYVTVELDDVIHSQKFAKFESLDGDTGLTLYFCKTCGCHVLRSSSSPSGPSLQVATGTIVDGPSDIPQLGPLINVAETIDGGLSRWLSGISYSDDTPRHYSPLLVQEPSTSASTVKASCLCGKVQLQIEHPNEKSSEPWSYLADLLIPYHTQDPAIKNKSDSKWWLRRQKTAYLAGTCACRSCRLVSGFEIQTWAFVPRVNIAVDSEPLDFESLHSKSTLRGYESSPGVIREFCPTCGATVFWHGADRSDLIDVSAGLFCSGEGARAEDLLEWWTGRVSFAEEVAVGRSGGPAERARALVELMQRAMRGDV